MRLKRVTLNNFRSFEHLTVDLHPRLTVIVGENGAGKTALLDGIATGLSPVLTHLSSAGQRLKGRGILDSDFSVAASTDAGANNALRPVKVADYCQIILETFDGLEWDEWRPFRSGKEPSEKRGEKQLRDHLIRILDSYQTGSPAITPIFSYYGARRGYIDYPERLHRAKNDYGFPTAGLIGCLDSLSDFREMLAWFDQEEAAELRANKGRTDDDFDEAPSLLAVRSAVESLLDRKYRSPHFNKDHRFVVLRIGDGVPLQVRQLSQGYQSMLAMAMDFARRLTIGNPHLAYPSYNSFVSDQMQEELFRLVDYLRHADMNSVPDLFGDRVHSGAFALEAPALMLVDEIDLHLHPLWQQRVLGDLMRTFPLTQFIVTTHSPQVLSTVRRENIRILRETEAGHEAVVPDFSPLAHESGDALARVMGTAVHPPLPVLETVQQYEQKVRAGLENSEDACNLKRTLDAAGYQFQDSDLALWRLLARRQARAG